ncbi:MAG TPA: PIN domain-containing protein [Candidatus Eremiobacteraeota bacterium]|nr:MAG: PIN domain protein [bacterium ADurb.Bin363]HPZ08460.1 PIN domain-containing protein [Candidatus Eremiobacteraeota bacterium]
MNKFFLDSSIIIEFLKTNGLEEAKKIMNHLYDNFLSMDLFINLVTIDETVYFYLKNKHRISFSLTELKIYLDSFNFLVITQEIKDEMFLLIENYKLKPHDSLIIATCKYYNVLNLISLDADFVTAGTKEKINLIDTIDKLKVF